MDLSHLWSFCLLFLFFSLFSTSSISHPKQNFNNQLNFLGKISVFSLQGIFWDVHRPKNNVTLVGNTSRYLICCLLLPFICLNDPPPHRWVPAPSRCLDSSSVVSHELDSPFQTKCRFVWNQFVQFLFESQRLTSWGFRGLASKGSSARVGIPI